MTQCGHSGVHQAGAHISYRIGPLCDAIVSLIGKKPDEDGVRANHGHGTTSAHTMRFVSCSHRTGKPKKQRKDLMMGGNLRTCQSQKCSVGASALSISIRVLGLSSDEKRSALIFGRKHEDKKWPPKKTAAISIQRCAVVYFTITDPCVATHCHFPLGIFTHVSVQRS